MAETVSPALYIKLFYCSTVLSRVGVGQHSVLVPVLRGLPVHVARHLVRRLLLQNILEHRHVPPLLVRLPHVPLRRPLLRRHVQNVSFIVTSQSL